MPSLSLHFSKIASWIARCHWSPISLKSRETKSAVLSYLCHRLYTTVWHRSSVILSTYTLGRRFTSFSRLVPTLEMQKLNTVFLSSVTLSSLHLFNIHSKSLFPKQKAPGQTQCMVEPSKAPVPVCISSASLWASHTWRAKGKVVSL